MKRLAFKQFNSLVGIAFFAVMGFVGYFTIIKKNVKEVKRATYLPVILATADHLHAGSPVTILGVPAGFIGSLHYVIIDETGNHFEPKEKYDIHDIQGQYVLAVLDLFDAVEIHENYKITTYYPTIASEKRVDIDPGMRRPEETFSPRFYSSGEILSLRSDRKIPPGESKTILHATNSDDPLYLLSSLIRENRSPVRRITFSLAEISEKINRGRGTLGALVNNPELYKKGGHVLLAAKPILVDARDALESYRETTQTIDLLKTLWSILLASLSPSAAAGGASSGLTGIPGGP